MLPAFFWPGSAGNSSRVVGGRRVVVVEVVDVEEVVEATLEVTGCCRGAGVVGEVALGVVAVVRGVVGVLTVVLSASDFFPPKILRIPLKKPPFFLVVVSGATVVVVVVEVVDGGRS